MDKNKDFELIRKTLQNIPDKRNELIKLNKEKIQQNKVATNEEIADKIINDYFLKKGIQ